MVDDEFVERYECEWWHYALRDEVGLRVDRDDDYFQYFVASKAVVSEHPPLIAHGRRQRDRVDQYRRSQATVRS
jgi:hypothetical protein